MTEQVRLPLPQSLMHAIETVVHNGAMPLSERFEAVVLIANGFGLYQQAVEVDPTAYAIPEAQWHAIGSMLMDAADQASGNARPGSLADAVTAVGINLAWMNYGPSSYKETGGE